MSPIPEPRLQGVQNPTPFALFQYDKMGAGGRFYDVVVLKGTFTLAPRDIVLAPQQPPIALVDEPWDLDHPERSSLRHAGEAMLMKPSTDIIVTGTARPPHNEPAREWEAGVEVRARGETRLAYRAQALGPRCWRFGARGWELTHPEPALELPLRYELAYGGAYPKAASQAEGAADPPWIVYPQNPSGTGFFDESTMDRERDYPAPRWQPLEHPVTQFNHDVPLAGFGPVARPWSDRLAYAGTYDDAWIEEARARAREGGFMDYAKDFDPRFFQCAHPKLVAPSYLVGDEEIILTGLMPAPVPYKLKLPLVRAGAILRDGERRVHQEWLRLDTVHLDLDAETVSLCWRLTLDQARDIRDAAIVLEETP